MIVKLVGRNGLVVLSALMVLVGLAVLLHLGQVWGARGLYADAHHTGGYTTGPEALLTVLGFLLIIGAVVVFVKSRKK